MTKTYGCQASGCPEQALPHARYCLEHQRHVTAGPPTVHRLERVVLVERREARTEPYEATCLMCGLEWSGRMTEWQALLVRVSGAKCGNCQGFVEVVPTLVGSIGSVRPTTVVKAMAMHRRGMVGAA